MSTVKSKKLQVGTDATSSNNFTIYQPATPDGTLRIGVGNADSPTEVGRFTSAGYKPATPVGIAMTKATYQDIAHATVTKIAYDTILYEYGGSNWNSSGGAYFIPYNGLYLVTHTVEMTGANVIHAGVYINGSNGGASKGHIDPWQQSGDSVVTGSNNHSVVNTKVYNLTVGDYLEFYTYHGSGGVRATTPTRTTFNIQLLALT